MAAKPMQERCACVISPYTKSGGSVQQQRDDDDVNNFIKNPSGELPASCAEPLNDKKKSCVCEELDPYQMSPRPYSSPTRMRRMDTTISRRGGGIINGRLLVSLLLITLVSVNLVEMMPFILFVGAAMVDSKPDGDDGNTDAIEATNANIDPDEKDGGNGNNADSPAEEPVPLPASLMKATRVGAKLREVHKAQDDTEKAKEPEMKSPHANNADDTPRNPKQPPLTGCHWGATGCSKKGKLGAGGPPGDTNASSIEPDAEDSPQGDEDAAMKSPPSSSLAGSATAKIEAHVMKGRGPTLSQRSRPASTLPVWERENMEPKSKETGHNPPQGFKLAGRIVTSPSDGLSYFLDAPQVDPDSNDGDWMMTIPYAYLECGPTIESTTEAFSLADMVLRHFPASASMRHWTNLGGGVTIENDMNEGGEDDGPRYIDGNNEGRPKLLVALSRVEITVSGNNEESRIFESGEVILMEDTLGKGHKMNAAPSKSGTTKKNDTHDRDLSVLMVSLPHTVHFPVYDWLEESSYLSESPDREESRRSAMHHSTSAAVSSSSPPTSFGAESALYGFSFGPRHLHHKNRAKRSSFATSMNKPCPIEYDSAYASLFMPNHNQHRRHRRNRRNPRWREGLPSQGSSFDQSYPPPPGFSTYEKDSILLNYLPSLRRTMLFGIGLSLTSSFIFCVQLLYPPMLVLFGGGTMIIGGSLLSVLVTRWGYRNWVANWEEEWRWKREVKRNKMHRDEMMKKHEVDEADQEDFSESDTSQSDADEDIDGDDMAQAAGPSLETGGESLGTTL
ncbi:hypothetical protein ACHAXR_005328 [Thalassiosira sp. AJA248-18]